MTGLREKWWTSIQGRLLLLLLCILIPVLAIQGYIYYNSYQKQRASEFGANLEIARAVAKTFESFVKDVLHQELAIGLALTSSQPMALKDITRLLESSRDYTAVRDFTWLNPQGHAIYSSDPDIIGRSYGDRSYFREVANGREWYVGELVTAKTTGLPVFGISRGIRDGKGALRGIVVAAIVPEKLEAHLAIERRKGGGFAVVDHKGMLVYRYPAIHTTWEERNWLRQYPWFEKVLKGEEIVNLRTFAHFEGKTRLLSATPLSSIGWAVTAATREEDLTGPILSSIAKSALLFLFVLLAAFFFALAFSRKITSPITALRTHALALGHGEMPAQVKINHVLEFQDLAKAFNAMAEKVQARERDLRDSEARFRSVLDNSQDVIYRLNMQTGRYDYISPSAEAVSGFSPDELMAMDLDTSLSMIHPDDLPGVRAMLARLEDAGKIELEYRQRTKNGDYRWISNHMSLVKDNTGLPLYRNGNIRDISDSKRAEEATRKLNEDLALKNSQLAETNRELESFIYSVSHDLRQPLRAIASFSQIAKKNLHEGLRGKEEGYLTRVIDSAARMSDIIEDMLKLSRVSRQAIKPEQIDMTRMAETVVSGIREAQPGRCASIKIGAGLMAVADRGLMTVVLENLIGNAWKFTARTKNPCIEFGTMERDDQTVYYVRDNGAGFDPEYAINMFKPFHRLHSESEFEGTGIGLSIVERIIGHHGGEVWAEGGIGTGATVYFTIARFKAPPVGATA